MKRQKYYRLYDPETQTYMATGCNDTSLTDLKDSIISWAEPGSEAPSRYKRMGARSLASHFNLVIEESDSPFEESDNFDDEVENERFGSRFNLF